MFSARLSLETKMALEATNLECFWMAKCSLYCLHSNRKRSCRYYGYTKKADLLRAGLVIFQRLIQICV